MAGIGRQLWLFKIKMSDSVDPVHISFDIYSSLCMHMIIYWPKKETSASHVCEFSPQDCSFCILLFFFKYCAFLITLCTKKKLIRYTFTATTMPQAPIPKLWKSHNQYLACLPFALFIAKHACLTERTSCCIATSNRCIPCCHDYWYNKKISNDQELIQSDSTSCPHS